jgi:hypothetical protein
MTHLDSTPAKKPTASERLAAAMGRPVPPPMTDEERREFREKMAREDEEIRRFYEQRDRTAS